MAYSFDISSEMDIQEVKNAIETASKEIRQRFDLKETNSTLELKDAIEIIVASKDEYTLKAVLDILQGRLIKRGVSLRGLIYEKVEKALGGTVRQKITLQQGIPQEKAKEIMKEIRAAKFKAQPQIQEDKIRVTGKDKDELQAVITFVKGKDFEIDLQFSNYR